MYAVIDSAEGDCYLCVPPDPGIEAVALGASESAAPGTGESAAPGAGESALSGSTPTEALHTFRLDSGALRSFFRDSTTLTLLSRPFAVSLADPSGGPVLAHSSTVLPCLAAPSGLLSGLHLPSFSTNLVSGADLQDVWVDQFTPGGQRVSQCTCSRTGCHLATFTSRLGSSLYTLTTASPPSTAYSQVAASGQVFAAASRSSPASAPCSCRPLSHETLLWHHRLGNPSLPCLRGTASRTLVSGLPRSLPPLPPGPAPTFVPCVEGLQCAAPHSSGFPPTDAPLQTLQMDVWGPARIRGQGHECYFLLVVDDYSRSTKFFPETTCAARLQPASPVPGPSPYSSSARGLSELESLPALPKPHPASPESRPESPVRAVRTGRRRVPLPSPPASSLPDGPDPESDSLRAASPTATRFLATVVTHPSFESTAASALVAELVDFAAACGLDHAASLVAESEFASVCPPSIGGECALGTDILEDRLEEFECFDAALPHLVSMLLASERDSDAPDIPTPRSNAEAIEGPFSSQWQTAMGTVMAIWKSTGTYVDEVPSPGANIVRGMWIFRVKRPPGSRSELQKRHPCTDLGELTSYLGLRITWDRAQRTITLTQSHMVQQVLQRFGFTYSSPQSTPLPTGRSLSAPPSDESVDLNGPHRKEHMDAAKRVLRYSTLGMGLVLGGRARLVLTGHADTSWADDLSTQRSSQGYTFSLGSGSVSWQSTRSSSVLSSNCEAEIYAGAMAAQELHWLTYLLTDLGEAPRSPPVLYRGQLCLAYVASWANTADVCTKALQPCDHQRFCTVLGLVPTVSHLLTS
ncbi:unnamed protein product [Closterium sp. NIES-53]